MDGDSRQAWMRDNDLDEARLARLLDDEARVGWISGIAALDAGGYILDQLRANGDYPRLMGRARAKQRALAARGLEDAGLSDAGLDGDQLLWWHFETRLGRPIPADIDQHCRELGLAGRADFERALAREYCYLEGESVMPGGEG